MSSVELIYDYFEDHVRAAAAVNERRPVALGVLCFLVGSLSLFLAQALAQRLHLFSFSWASLILTFGWKVAAGFLMAAVLHLILEIFGVKGSAVALFVLLGLADLSWVLALPLVLLARLVFERSSWAVTAVFFGVGLLCLSLKARSLQDNYRIGAGRAWLTLGLPYLAMTLAVALALSMAMMRLVLEFVKAFH